MLSSYWVKYAYHEYVHVYCHKYIHIPVCYFSVNKGFPWQILKFIHWPWLLWKSFKCLFELAKNCLQSKFMTLQKLSLQWWSGDKVSVSWTKLPWLTFVKEKPFQIFQTCLRRVGLIDDTVSRHFHISSITIGRKKAQVSQTLDGHCQDWTNQAYVSTRNSVDRIYRIKVGIYLMSPSKNTALHSSDKM